MEHKLAGHDNSEEVSKPMRRLILTLVLLLLPVLPVRAHHAIDGRIMCPFSQQHCPPGPIPGK